jgi:ParB-like chromosome segregation protein Spo0J
MAKSKAAGFRDRIKELRRVPASSLLPNPKNWRTHPQAQQDALRGILSEIGIADAVLARELPDGSLMLIDGHLRAETVADAMVPVLILDVTESEADKMLATLDPLAAMADKDAERLASLLATLKQQEDALAPLCRLPGEPADLVGCRVRRRDLGSGDGDG